mmetsp:Transcript_22703/g.53635  ORF Transcript_22703/g.53635 Transcript_22703/m.53635 type:complete len:321 (-) Transcript_22703:61-1023(-)
MNAPNSPVSFSTNGGPRSEPGSPVNQVGRHWLTTHSKKPLRIPTSPKLMDSDDYVMDLSNPSPTEEEYRNRRGFNDMTNGNMPIVDRAPQDLSDLDAPGGRRHVGDNVVDGSALYQASAMHPTDWSCKSSDGDSVGASTIDEEGSPNDKHLLSQDGKEGAGASNIVLDSTASANRKLINDLVWLEKKIATVRGESPADLTALAISTQDSLSFDSNDKYDGSQVETSTDESSTEERNPSNILVKDVIAPPGRLHTVIHSTKDGPEVHTVKEESRMKGEIFPGDLIIAVDGVDTRTFTAEEVMEIMASKGDQKRKISVLRFK